MHDSWRVFPILGIVAVVLFFTNSPLSLISKSYAHFDHLPIYNGGADSQSRYSVYQALGSDYAQPQEPTVIMFSVQDRNGNDMEDIEAMIEVYTSSGERIKAYPWTKYDSGDFEIPFTFPEAGSYQIVLSTADGPVQLDSADLPRAILSSTSGCGCERSIFNVAISERFGIVWNSTIVIAIGAPLTILGGVLGLSYRKRRMTRSGSNAISTLEVVKYSVMLSAIAGGIVHFSVYVSHATLRLEYSIFFIVAGGMQAAYGTMYIFLTFATVADRNYYRKSLAINLFGFTGTAILVGLYAYTVVLPAPLSPTGIPDSVEVAGILAKSLEVFLLIAIIYIMRMEKRTVKQNLNAAN